MHPERSPIPRSFLGAHNVEPLGSKVWPACFGVCLLLRPSFSVFMVVENNPQPLRAARLLAFSAVGGAILLPFELEWDGGG